MTNVEWFQLLHSTADKIRALGYEIVDITELPLVITCAGGVIGGTRGEKDLYGAAQIGADSGIISVRRLIERPPTVGVDLEIKQDFNGSLPVKSFEELAKYILLHEVGHRYYGHKDHSPAQQRQANDFALNLFRDI